MSKKKNWKVGKVVEYYKEDGEEDDFSVGERVEISSPIDVDGDFYVKEPDGSRSSFFNKKYLRKIPKDMSKKKNWEVGKVVEYYRQDREEGEFQVGELVEIVDLMNSSNVFRVRASRPADDRSSYFNKRYLREIAKENIVVEDNTADEKPEWQDSAQSGTEDPRVELARRLIISPSVGNKYIVAANVLVNRYVDGGIDLHYLKSSWGGLILISGVLSPKVGMALIYDKLIETGEL